MPRFPSYKPREVIKKLKKLGFVKHHQVGSHLTLKHPLSGKRAVVPVHLKDLKKGTLMAILKEADINIEDFGEA